MRKEIIGKATLYHADCREVMAEIGRVDAVVTDPPYAIPTQVAQTREITRNAGDLSIAETAYRVYADDWSKAVGDNGRVFVFCDGASYPSLYRAMFSQFNLALLVWDKGRIGMGREFRKSHELIAHGWKSATPIFTDGVGRPDIIKSAPLSSSARIHPAEKPVGILSEILRVCGDRIFDPFMGSGSTALAATRLGKAFVGTEIEQTYFDAACRRLESSQRDLLDAAVA